MLISRYVGQSSVEVFKVLEGSQCSQPGSSAGLTGPQTCRHAGREAASQVPRRKGRWHGRRVHHT
eukprot:5319937-Heterocapsa_arctica.AAC.1